MASLEELRAERIKKLETLRARGVDPYPADSHRDAVIGDVISDFDGYAGREGTVAGRVMAIRKHGGVVFADLFDGSGPALQGLLRSDILSADGFVLFDETVDIGDFVELSGTFITTKRGEKSLEARSWRMLAKALQPIPSTHFGLEDEEERLRKRYLDMLLSPDLRQMVERRASFWRAIRSFLEGESFLEVETPVLERTTGGADARPFATHHNALDLDLYLRISAGELWQKRLMVAGFPKVFEIGRIFRNEGISYEHAQDYTQMEFYMAYADYKDGMALVERLYKYVAEQTFGTLRFAIGEHDVDLGVPWKHYDYAETLSKMTGLDIGKVTIADIEKKIAELKIPFDKKGWNRVRAIDTLWKHCRKQISGPGFLVNVPRELSPLAKTHRDNPANVEQFQVMIAGSEVGKGYSELNDPMDQAERFEAQAALREAGDEEAHMYDRDFVEALEYGMPPTCGFGVSERLFAFLSNRSIREVELFPLLRPKE